MLKSRQPAPSDTALDLNIDVANLIMDNVGPVVTDDSNLLTMPEYEGLGQ